MYFLTAYPPASSKRLVGKKRKVGTKCLNQTFKRHRCPVTQRVLISSDKSHRLCGHLPCPKSITSNSCTQRCSQPTTIRSSHQLQKQLAQYDSAENPSEVHKSHTGSLLAERSAAWLSYFWNHLNWLSTAYLSSLLCFLFPAFSPPTWATQD